MAAEVVGTNNKVLLHAARTDNADLFCSIVEADPAVAYDINFVDGVGNSALHYACEQASTHVLGLILEEEVDVDLKNRLEGDTPLHLACRIPDEEVRNWVGASPTITNKAGLRPIDTVVGAQAESPLGQALLDMLTTQQAVAQLDTNDIAYGTLHDLPDDDDIADGDSA